MRVFTLLYYNEFNIYLVIELEDFSPA